MHTTKTEKIFINKKLKRYTYAAHLPKAKTAWIP